MGYAAISNRELWELYSQNRFDEELVTELTRRYIPMVRAIVNKFRLAHNVVEDALQAAFIGLLEAFQHFDPTRGLQFTTYGQQRVRGAVIDYIRKQPWTQVRLTRGEQVRIHNLRELEERFILKHQRFPENDRELADFAGQPLSNIKEARWLEQSIGSEVELDAHYSRNNDGHSIEFGELIELTHSTHDHDLAEASDERDMLRAFMKLLPERQRLVLYYKYYQEMTNKRIAEIIGVSEARIFQLLEASIHKLRETYALPDRIKRFMAAFIMDGTDESHLTPSISIKEQGKGEVPTMGGTVAKQNYALCYQPAFIVAVLLWWKVSAQATHSKIDDYGSLYKEAGLQKPETHVIFNAIAHLKKKDVVVSTGRCAFRRGKTTKVKFAGEPVEPFPKLLPGFKVKSGDVFDLNELAERMIRRGVPAPTPPAPKPTPPANPSRPEPAKAQSQEELVSVSNPTPPTNGKTHHLPELDYPPLALRAKAEGLRAQAAELIRKAEVLEEAARMKDIFAQAKEIMES